MKFSSPIISVGLLLIFGCQSNYVPEGGYDYVFPVSAADTNFYFLPLRTSVNKSDSAFMVHASHLFRAFDERNLSIEYSGKHLFRMLIEQPSKPPVIILWREGEIIVKKGKPGIIYDFDDSPQAKIHFSVPFQQFRFIPSKNYVDGDLGKTGFWKLPYVYSCSDTSHNQTVFILEAHTRKYQCVRSTPCSDPNSAFHAICQQIIEMAGLQKEIQLYTPPDSSR